MSLNIKDEMIHKMARDLAALDGVSITAAVRNALDEKLRQSRRKNNEKLVEAAMAIGRHCAALPLLDKRSAEEIIGYDDNGLPR